MAVAVTQNDSLGSAFTSVLLDVLAIIFLLFGLIVFGFSFRKGATTQSNAGTKPPRRPVAALSVAMLALPLLGLIFVWTNIPSPTVPPTPTPSIVRHTPTATPKPTLDLVTPGTLTIGSVTNYPPQEYMDANRNTGFDIDLINAIAKEMGLQPDVIPTATTDNLFSGLSLTNKQFDVVISALPITTNFLKRAQFIPYLKSVESMLVAKNNTQILNVKALNDLCGKTVGVLDVSSAMDDLNVANAQCKKNNSAMTIMPEMDTASITQLLQNSKIDVAYLDTPVAQYYVNQSNGAFEIVGSGVKEKIQEGIAVSLGKASVFNAVKKAFLALQKDGT